MAMDSSGEAKGGGISSGVGDFSDTDSIVLSESLSMDSP